MEQSAVKPISLLDIENNKNKHLETGKKTQEQTSTMDAPGKGFCAACGRG